MRYLLALPTNPLEPRSLVVPNLLNPLLADADPHHNDVRVDVINNNLLFR